MTQTTAETLYLVDGSGYIFRAFHALPDMTRADGTHVNAVYGFCAMIHKLKAELQAERIAVIFDAGRRTFRHDIWPEYKANRPPPPPELVPQFALIRDATRAFGLPAIEAANYEADDLLATYARMALDARMHVRIVSADKDLMQLVRPGVTLYDPMKNVDIGPDAVVAKFGVPPDKVVDVQALAGDSTDNVPGVPGIGIKTAAQLIVEYGDLDTLLGKASAIKQPKRREALIQFAEQARISKKLVTLDDAVPLPEPLDALRARPDHHDALVAFLQEQGFRSLVTRITGALPTDARANQTPKPLPRTDTPVTHAAPVAQEYALIQDAAALAPWIAAAREQGYVAIDTETDSLTPSTTTLIGVSLAIAPGKACYIPVGHVAPSSGGAGALDFGDAPRQMSLTALRSSLSDLLADPSVLKIAHNMKFDMQVLESHGLPLASWDDTMLMSYALEAGLHGHGLDELAALHCGHTMISFSDVVGVGQKRIAFDRVPLDRATAYAAEDADFTLRLWLLLKPRLAQQHVTRVYERMERPLIPVVATMERAGIRIDPAMLARLSQDFSVRLGALETDIHALAGRPFNVGSPKQLGDILFGDLGLPGGTKSKTGAYATGAEILEPLAEAGHAIAARVLDWRGLSKLKATYADALPRQIDARTGRVHTSFSLVGAATGRLSSTDPNLQNIPIRTEDGRAIRRAFIAAEGCSLLSVDYSQIEIRLAAAVAGIQTLIAALCDGADIHALTASQVFGMPLNDVTAERRRAAKAINFGIIYGLSGFGLARQIGCTPAEGNAFIRAYLDRFPELRDWMESVKDFARAHGYVETLFGRKVHIAGIRDKVPARRAFAERQAINAPLQGTAADIMKRAMIRMPEALARAGLSAKLLLQVHDELVFEVPTGDIDATAALVKRVMEDAPLPVLSLSVPLTAESGHAPNWAEAH